MHCAICQTIAAAPDHYVFQSEHWVVRHSLETNLEGYLVLESRRHILDLSQATPEEIESYGPTLALATRVIWRAVAPERVYTFTLGESFPHMHVHLIPKGAGMPRAWQGRGIMSYPLTPAVNAAAMPEICSSIRAEFKRQNTARLPLTKI